MQISEDLQEKKISDPFCREEIEEKLGYKFRDRSLLKQAFTHKSHLTDMHNDKLEWLGDAILGYCVVDYLYKLHPQLSVKSSNLMKSFIVSNKILSKMVHRLQIGRHLVGKGVKQSSKTISDLLEAVIGAIYLDTKEDIEYTKTWVKKQLKSVITTSTLVPSYRTQLQEYSLAHYKRLPHYTITTREMRGGCTMHAKLIMPNNDVVYGYGTSIKKAKDNADMWALVYYGKIRLRT